jgi:hypothetical protein
MQQILNEDNSSSEEVEDYLNNLKSMPDDEENPLKITYDFVFERIKKLPSSPRQRAARVFKWLLAMGSCELSVLLAAVSQRELKEDTHKQVDRRVGLVKTCKGLVVIEGRSLRLSHWSVQNYCER